MEYVYEMDLAEMMTYQEQLFLSEMSPAIKDSVKRWERLVLILLVVLVPLILFSIFMNFVICIVALMIGGVVFLLFKRKSTLYFWENYKSKAKKDLLLTYFNNEEGHRITYTLRVFSNKLEIESIFAKKTIQAEDIIFKKITDQYIFFYTNKHEASLIPLEKLKPDRESMINWFADEMAE